MTTAARKQELQYEKMATTNLSVQIPTPDIWKTRLRVFARNPMGASQDISGVVDSITWNDQSSDDLQNINTQAAMVGSITVKKQNLRDYKKLQGLIYPGAYGSESARVGAVGVGGGVAAPGALGAVIVLQSGYGNTWTNIWAMRVTPGFDGNAAESVNLSDGTDTLNLCDDLWNLGQTVADFKYTKGKTTRKQGWRCDQIARDVCSQYRIPVRKIAQGTAFFELPVNKTQLTSPLKILSLAYAEETKRTGRTFIIRWGPPGRIYPLGALEITPMRRNQILYKFRDQLTEATLTRSQGPDWATVVEGRANLKVGKTTKKITHTEINQGAVKRHGFIRKTVNFGTVESALELQILCKRSLAIRLTPLRTAELTHPGFPTIRRGDAIHINIPEEGYSEQTLKAYSTISEAGKSKAYIAALRAAEKADPLMFDKSSASAGGDAAAAADGSDPPADANTPAILPVSNQGIAYVTTATHTASAGEYTMDLVCGFINVLDPNTVRAQVDAAVRAFKAGKPITPGLASPLEDST